MLKILNIWGNKIKNYHEIIINFLFTKVTIEYFKDKCRRLHSKTPNVCSLGLLFKWKKNLSPFLIKNRQIVQETLPLQKDKHILILHQCTFDIKVEFQNLNPFQPQSVWPHMKFLSEDIFSTNCLQLKKNDLLLMEKIQWK